MSKTAQFLVADDDRSIRTFLVHALTRQGYSVSAVTTLAGLWDYTMTGRGNILITDVGFPDGDVLDVLPRIKKKRPDLQIIIMSARTNLLTAIKAQKHEVIDYFPKPFELGKLIEVCNRAALLHSNNGKEETLITTINSSNISVPDAIPIPLVGQSAAMQNTFKLLTRYSATKVPVLIHAEAGAEKEEIARTLCQIGTQEKIEFMSLNLSHTPQEEHLNLLFGQENIIKAAANCSLFINNIELLSEDAQRAFMRYLDNPNSSPFRPDRIIVGTCVDLRNYVSQGLFRDDLYFSLSSAYLTVPPLRERIEDIKTLANLIVKSLSEEFGVAKKLQSDAVTFLQSWNWPGNLRELIFLLRRLFVNADSYEITAINVSEEIKLLQINTIEDKKTSLGDSAQFHIDKYLKVLEDKLPSSGLYDRIIQEVEKPLIYATMKRTSGNQIKASEILGINRNTLRKKIKQLNLPIKRDEYR
ncbi:response regulator [Alphaproteobacteria bacterium]|nr:response regulator [Alphaproteobacteria bacterium]